MVSPAPAPGHHGPGTRDGAGAQTSTAVPNDNSDGGGTRDGTGTHDGTGTQTTTSPVPTDPCAGRTSDGCSGPTSTPEQPRLPDIVLPPITITLPPNPQPPIPADPPANSSTVPPQQQIPADPRPPENPSKRQPTVVVPTVRPADPPTPAATAPAPSIAPQPAALELTPTAIGLGGDVTAAGSGCDPQSQVSLLVGQTPVGNAVAGADGGFRAPLALTSIEVGRYEVTARCGRTLTAPLDVVLVSRISSATSTLTLILFFLLIGAWFYGHRLVSHLPARREP
ncbi:MULTISPECIES: hypothetical protein [unclassified Nocardia]|uniref:hypothetical protein n=1 Tax=unclassified Nocardia TaxID=2637762 RepID=UPI00341C08D4